MKEIGSLKGSDALRRIGQLINTKDEANVFVFAMAFSKVFRNTLDHAIST